MPLVLADRVRETTTTAGTGTVTLAGAVTGYQTFAAVGNGNTTYYCIAGQGTSEWEVGIGTYTSSGTTLSRDTVLASSAGGAKVTFSAGTKDVFVTYPSGKSINEDASDNVGIGTTTPAAKLDIASGNLLFSSTAQRITGDFSNATRNNRVLFQTTTANDATSVGVIPNGTSNVANFGISNSSNPDNAAVCVMSISGSTAGLNSSKLGTGTTLPLVISVDSVMRLQFNTDGTINSFDSASAVGYKGVPLNEQAAAYTLVLADQGKTIVHPITDNNARTFTIPANGTVAFPVGTAITFINMINTVTISITTDTMYLAGVGTTGNRTLAAYGMATAVKITSTSWIISGNGLS